MSEATQEPLAPEAGGTVFIEDYNGNEEGVEMAQSPFATDKIPKRHYNGDEPLEH